MADGRPPTEPPRADSRGGQPGADGRGGQTGYHPDLEWRQTVRGAKPGDRYVRIATHRGFTRVGKNHLVPRPGTGEPTSGLGRWAQRLKHVLLGNPGRSRCWRWAICGGCARRGQSSPFRRTRS